MEKRTVDTEPQVFKLYLGATFVSSLFSIWLTWFVFAIAGESTQVKQNMVIGLLSFTVLSNFLVCACIFLVFIAVVNLVSSSLLLRPSILTLIKNDHSRIKAEKFLLMTNRVCSVATPTLSFMILFSTAICGISAYFNLAWNTTLLMWSFTLIPLRRIWKFY